MSMSIVADVAVPHRAETGTRPRLADLAEPWEYLRTTRRPRSALRSIESLVRSGWQPVDATGLMLALYELLTDRSRPPRVVLRCCRIFAVMDMADVATRRASVRETEVKPMSATLATATAADDYDDCWITAAHACVILACNYKALRRMTAKGRVTTRAYDGVKARYSKASVERLAKSAVRPAVAG